MKKRLVIAMLGLGMLLAYTIPLENTLSSIKQRLVVAVQELAWASGTIGESYPPYASPPQKGSDSGPSEAIPLPSDVREIDYRIPVNAALQGNPKERHRVTYDNVIDQFAVEANQRYSMRENLRGEMDTFCHTFVWDVTRAMGAQVPYWVGKNDQILEPWLTEQGLEMWLPAYDMRANDMNQWLNHHGSQHGWRKVSADEAQEMANLGHPTVSSVYDPHGVGHVGIVRPGSLLNGPALAQAGTHNVNYAHVYDYFPFESTQFFVNDIGNVAELD